METVNGDFQEGPPPSSPLTGCYLLIVVGEPHSVVHKDIILQKIVKGFLSWNSIDCLVDLEKEMAVISEQSLEGEEARHGERLIQFASENLITEILIHPVVSTLVQCMRNLLSSFTRHRHIIHAGYTFASNGSWALQDGTFSYTDFSEAFQEIETQRVIHAYENSISIDIHCSSEGDWGRLSKETFAKGCNIRINPPDVLTSGSQAFTQFIKYISQFIIPTSLESLLQSSDVVGNIRFSRPTLYVFPGGQGDAALFGVNGFNMLLDGGFSRKACFWDFVRHLDRLDAVLMTRLNNSNIGGISSLLRRKRKDAVYPHIGHFFCNIQDTKNTSSPDGDKDGDALLIDLLNEGREIISNLHHLNLNPQECYRDQEPINLYHKVGHGTLNMYVLNPAKDSKEVKEFLQKWNQSDQKIFSKQNREFTFPIQNLISIAVLIIWQPANISDTVTRLLYPGSTPQQKIFESLEKIKDIEFTKYPVCSEKFLYSKFVITKATKIDKGLIKEKAVESKEKMAVNNNVTLPGENKTKRSAEYDKSKKNKVENNSQQRKTAIEKKDSPFTTPKKSMDQEGPRKSVITPAKSTKDANNRRVIENKTKLLKSVESRTNLEKRDISKKSKTLIKSPKSHTKRLTKVRQKTDSTFKKGKTEKDCTTDSSTVSTPTDHDSLRKDILNLNSEDVQPLKAQELADLDEEQEAVKEIEAVFRKGELPHAGGDMRKIKTISMDEDKSEKEDYLIIEKEVIDGDLLNENKTKENEFQKLTRVNEESEKPTVHLAQNLPSPQKEVKKTVGKLENAESELSNIKKSDREVEIKEIPESHADEKMSGNIKSGDTTTAPTLPEDERIPLEDIKEDNAYHIEEKYGKEKTKEKDVPLIQLPSKTFEAVTMSPGVVGIYLDKQNHVRDIVKTPDEVADLPVHEEVDYEFAHETKIATKTTDHVQGESKEEGIQVQPENNEEMGNSISSEKPYILKNEKIENKLHKALDEDILSCENINNTSMVGEGQQYLIKEAFEKADEEVMETKLTPTEQNKEETHISKSKKEISKELRGTENKLKFKATEDNKQANKANIEGNSETYNFNEEQIILNQSNPDFKGSKDDLPVCMGLNSKANLIDLKDETENTEISLPLIESKDFNTSTNKQCEESQDTSTFLKLESTEGQNGQGNKYKSEHKTQHSVITTDKETFESHASKTSNIVSDCKNEEPIQSTESEMKLIKNREEDVIKIVATVAEVLKSEAPLEEFEKKLPLTFDSSQTSFTTQLRETHITTMGTSDEIENKATTLSFPENVFRKILNNDEEDGSCEINVIKINENMKGIDEKEKQGNGKMLVTISSEDKREELEICPTGGTTFSKSSESSSRSSPEKSQESKKSSMVDTISDTINTVKHVTEWHLGPADNVEKPNEISGILGDNCSERQSRTKLDSIETTECIGQTEEGIIIEKTVIEHSQTNEEDGGQILPLLDIVDNVKDVATISNLSPKDFLSDAKDNKLNKEEKQYVNYDDVSTNIEQFVTEKIQVKEMYKRNLETDERVDVEDTLNDSLSRLLKEKDHDPMGSKKCIFQADKENIKEQKIQKYSDIDKKEAELISPSNELVDVENATDMPTKQIDANISTIVGQVTTNKGEIIRKSEVSLDTNETEKDISNVHKEKMCHDWKLKDIETNVKSCDDKCVITDKPINTIVTLGISDKSKNLELDPVIILSEKSEKASKDEGAAELKSKCFEKDVLNKGNTIDETTTPLNVDESGDIIRKYSEKSETIIEKNEDLNLTDVNESQNNELQNCPSEDKNEKKYLGESIIQKKLKPERETGIIIPSEKAENSSKDEGLAEMKSDKNCFEKDVLDKGNTIHQTSMPLNVDESGDIITKYSETSETIIEKYLKTEDLNLTDAKESQNNKLQNCPSEDKNGSENKPECLQANLKTKVQNSTKQYENEEDGIDIDTSEKKFKTEKSFENKCKEYQIDNELNKNKHVIVTSATALATAHPSSIDIKAPCKLEDNNDISNGNGKEIAVMNYKELMQESSYGFLPNNATELLDNSQISSTYLYEITKAKYISPRNPCIENIVYKNFKEKEAIDNVTNMDTTEIILNEDLKDQIQIEGCSSLEEKKSLPDDTKYCKTFLYEKTIAIYRNPNVQQSENYAEVLPVWSKPLGLPSPAPANDNNKSTPKKERKLLLNVTTKNKWNDEKKRSEASSKSKNKKTCPIYVDLTYVPHHGNSYYSYIDFFKTVRARYYVFSGIEPSREVYNALLEAKQTWDDKELEVTIIPTYDTDVLGYWVAENEELLAKYKIDLSPSASRCTINLQDHETSCSAYRLEF